MGCNNYMQIIDFEECIPWGRILVNLYLNNSCFLNYGLGTSQREKARDCGTHSGQMSEDLAQSFPGHQPEVWI